MSWGRVLSSCFASLAVAGCAVVVVGMSNAASKPSAAHPSIQATPTARPALIGEDPGATAAAEPAAAAEPSGSAPTGSGPTESTSGTTAAAPTSSAAPTTGPPPAASVAPIARRPAAVAPSARAANHAAPARPAARPRPAAKAQPKARTAPHAAARGSALPLRYSTGSATRVVTVVARSHASTTARLQAWTKAAGGGWRKVGGAVTAHVGSQGLTSHTSESKSATPIGSFTLTQAFGHNRNPGTHLPYFKTTPSDYWISHSGKYYNTHQRCTRSHCASGASTGRGDERLYYETPYYNYAVVIDANTRNAPGGVHAGRGSAFFLHVTDGRPTAGCVAISQSELTSIMRWLTPSAHPRILIGVG